MKNGKRSSPWLKALGIGCGLVLLCVFVGTGLVAWNWQALSRVYHQAKATVSELMQVQVALQTRYGGTVTLNVNRRSGVEGTTLSITLTNPSFIDKFDWDGPGGRNKALEVARAARDALSGQSAYARYEVIVARQRDVGVRVSSTSTYLFESGDLSPAAR